MTPVAESKINPFILSQCLLEISLHMNPGKSTSVSMLRLLDNMDT